MLSREPRGRTDLSKSVIGVRGLVEEVLICTAVLSEFLYTLWSQLAFAEPTHIHSLALERLALALGDHRSSLARLCGEVWEGSRWAVTTALARHVQATEDQPREIEDIYWEVESNDLGPQESRNSSSYGLVTHWTHGTGSEVKSGCWNITHLYFQAEEACL